MFFGMLRVKNEERWIERALKPLVEVCDEVFVMDDHSTDHTREIVQDTSGCVYFSSTFDGLDESRDKTWLLSRIECTLAGKDLTKNSPHWVICVDGDEEICTGDLHKFTQELRGVSYSFQILQLHDSPDQMRVDPPYDRTFRPSMFRLVKPGMVFKSQARHGGGFHCSNVPADIGFAVIKHEPEPVRVKHYGYMGKEDRERKYKFYIEHDPGHRGWYNRECFGEPKLAGLPEGL